jgi:hypothetical protein
VYVLSKKGADFLNSALQDVDEDGVLLSDFEQFFSGKSVGKDVDQKPGETWIPCHSWRHDLLAQGVLRKAWAGGSQILTEIEIRQSNSGRRINQKRAGFNADIDIKIPDGLINFDGTWTAIEVERSGKFASYGYELARFVLAVSAGGTHICGRLVTRVAIVYEDPKRRHYLSDERHLADHFERVLAAVQRAMRPTQSVQLIGIPVSTEAGGVEDMTERVQIVTYDFDKAARAWLQAQCAPDAWRVAQYKVKTQDGSIGARQIFIKVERGLAYWMLTVSKIEIGRDLDQPAPADGVMQTFNVTLLWVKNDGSGAEKEISDTTLQSTTLLRAQASAVKWLETTPLWDAIDEDQIDIRAARAAIKSATRDVAPGEQQH